MVRILKRASPRILLHLFAALLCATFFAPQADGAIVNGGFEDILDSSEPVLKSSLDSWTVTQLTGPGDPTYEVLGRDTTLLYTALAPHGGNIAAMYFSSNDATGNGASLSQASTTDTSKTYNVSLWLANSILDTGNFNNVFSVSWDGALISLSGANITEIGLTKTYIVTPNTGWTQITATNLPVTSTSTNLIISARNNNWATLVDDVVVEETPEPSTLVMLGVGVAAMSLRRRRQRGL